jgi:alpha-beta hydrolase superfamily lysophospholipase
MVDVHNDNRAPLLLVAGGNDHISPPAVVKATHHLYKKSTALTEYIEYPERTHYTLGQKGWEEVADYVLAWALRNARQPERA